MRFVLFLLAVLVVFTPLVTAETVVVTMRVTAYCPCQICCGPNAKGITASGKAVTFNGGKFVAAPKSYPFGTMFTVPGYNNGSPVPVQDRGGAIKGNKLDVYFPTHQEALDWGVQNLNVEVEMKKYD